MNRRSAETMEGGARTPLTLKEEGYYPHLTTSFAEKAHGVVTSAGMSFTSELVIGFISEFLGQSQLAELGSHMLFDTLRDNATEQPKSAGFLTSMYDPLIEKTTEIMQDNVAEPMLVAEIASRIGISTRQLKRLFKTKLSTSPSRYYKQLRVKRAHILVTGTNLTMFEIAQANGFSSVSTLSKAYRSEFGVSPSQKRSGKGSGAIFAKD